MKFEELRIKTLAANKALVEHGLVVFTFGNVSMVDRKEGVIAIKPSGVGYEEMSPGDIVVLDLDGRIAEGSKKPSSDAPTHIELYKNFNEIGAIVHTHSKNATAFAQAKKPIPCLGTTHADYFYGEIPVTREMTKEEVERDYERNTGRVIVELFNEKGINPLQVPACLVAGHGPFAWGRTVDSAVYNAVMLEEIAGMAVETLELNPNAELPSFLLDKHFFRKHGKNAYYGQKEQ
ncbi:L-ribulose-5-phosphate 4-epimerase [Candidatus Micrarchaeota archaeon]|nr:L-ribulose-5-phosphate 4-epimerase [Candidatus Micrarchaeota archaeon]